MLSLNRYEGESITIGNDIDIVVQRISGKQVKIGIKAPDNVAVHRSEIADEIGRDHSLSKVNGERGEEFRARDKSG